MPERGPKFWTWLLTQRQRTDAIGDLARDAFQDESWPRKARLFASIDRYLITRKVPVEVRAALILAYEDWQGRTAP